MSRPVGSVAVASREDVVVRAFRRLLNRNPGGWFAATELQAAIAEDLAKDKSGSTVREAWRVGRAALKRKHYLSAKAFDTPRGHEIRYYLRAIDGRITIPYDQYRDLSSVEREALFPPPVLTEEERRRRFKANVGPALEGLVLLRKLALGGATTDELEAELLSRFSPPDPPSPFAQAHPEMLELQRPPSATFAREVLSRTRIASGRQTRRLAERRTANRQRGAPGHRPRARPSRSSRST